MVKSLWLYYRIIFVLQNQKNLVSSAVKLWKAYGLAQMCACVMLSGPRVQTMSCGSHLTLSPFSFHSICFEIRQWRFELFLNFLVIIHSMEDVLWYSGKCHRSVMQYEVLSFNFSVFQLWCEAVIKRRVFQYLWPPNNQTAILSEISRSYEIYIFNSRNVFKASRIFIALWLYLSVTKTMPYS